MKRVVINIFGKVQMEGFRFITLYKARSLDIKGYVKNLRDGSVEIEAEGQEPQIEKFIEWCKVGPPYAKIGKVIIEEVEVKNLIGKFEILEK